MVPGIQTAVSFGLSGYEANIRKRQEILLLWNCVDFYWSYPVRDSGENDSKNVERQYNRMIIVKYLNLYKYSYLLIYCHFEQMSHL